MQIYPITKDGIEVGKATVERCGLYYHIHCKCLVEEAGLYRVRLRCDDYEQDMGTCLKTEYGYEIETRIPCKKITGETLSFFMDDPCSDSGDFYPLEEGNPVTFLDTLINSRFQKRNGITGILLPKSNQLGSDLNPRHHCK